MNNNNTLGLNDLLSLFENEISISDITSAKLLGKISAAIVKKRNMLEMTQKEFAKYINVSQSMVSKWEGGDYNFSIKALAEIAEKLDMRLDVSLESEKNSYRVFRSHDKKNVFVWLEKNRCYSAESYTNNIALARNCISVVKNKEQYRSERSRRNEYDAIC